MREATPWKWRPTGLPAHAAGTADTREPQTWGHGRAQRPDRSPFTQGREFQRKLPQETKRRSRAPVWICKSWPRRAEQKQRDTQGRYRTDYGPGSLVDADADAVSTTQVKTTMHHDWAGLTQHTRPAGHPMLATSTGRRKITDRIASTHSEKAFNKVQRPFIMKILSKLRRGCVNLIKNTHKIPTNSHHLRGEKVEAFLVRSGTRPPRPSHHCFLAARCTYLLLRWLCSETGKIKHMQIGKEDVKLPLCTDYTIINIETLKESRKTNQPSSNKPLRQRYGVKVFPFVTMQCTEANCFPVHQQRTSAI